MRRSAVILLAAGSLPLGGCLASMAASAVGAAVSAANAERDRRPYGDLRQPAVDACRARAAQQGEVRIIDAEQGRAGRVTVWGTVQDAQQRRAFECVYNGRVATFRLRAIQPGRP